LHAKGNENVNNDPKKIDSKLSSNWHQIRLETNLMSSVSAISSCFASKNLRTWLNKLATKIEQALRSNCLTTIVTKGCASFT